MSKRSSGLPSQPFQGRLEACRCKIHQKLLDGYLVTNLADQYYFTGFSGEDGAVLILKGRVYLLTDGRFAEEAERSAPWAVAVVRHGALADALGTLVRRHRLKRIGFDPGQVSVQAHRRLGRAIQPAKLVTFSGLAEDLRIIKDAGEQAIIERAVRIAESAFKKTIKRIQVGMTERELAADLQHELLRQGADEPSFPIIVAEGSRSSLPHAVPGDRRIRAGSAVLIDWGARVGHYCSDLTRVIFIHRIPPRFKRMYTSVLAAQMAAIEAVRPGVRMCEVDGVARASLRQAKLDAYFTHSLGHGIGLDIHERPAVSPRVTKPLKAGMVLTIEPGVYRPGTGGVRIEDDVLVTERGCRVLSRLPKDLDSMVV